MTVKTSIIVVNTNEKRYVGNCLTSLLNLQSQEIEIIVVDNGSTDGSVEYIAKQFPSVKVVEAGKNLGFSGANNLGVQRATGTYLVFLNPDTTVEKGSIEALTLPLEKDPKIGLTTAKILLMATPDRINTCGNDVHFTGFGYLRGWQAPASSNNNVQEVCSVSGAAFAIPRALFTTLEGFDEAFFPIYVEDTDLSWRARIAGYRVIYVPDSVVSHDYKSGFGSDKFFRLERNRHQMLLKTYRLPTLILLTPALLLSETVSWGYAFLHGSIYIRNKVRAYQWIGSNVRTILARRKKVQNKRAIADRSLFLKCSPHLAIEQAGSGMVVRVSGLIFNALFFMLYYIYLLLIWW